MILLLMTACADGGCEKAWRFVDADGDGYGAGAATILCVTEGSDRDDDCDDTVATAHPGGEEHCDGVDEDCDGEADNDAPDGPGWYPDLDHDGFGDPADVHYSCTPIHGRVTDATDCDDRYITVHPGASEVCNLRDDDCDGVMDEDALNPVTVYADLDGDGWGDIDGETTIACPGLGGWGLPADCDDADPDRHPEAMEVCDGVDQDCDSVVDEGAIDPLAWPADADGDGYGSPTEVVYDCTLPAGAADNTLDCDDGDPTFNPDAAEVCSPAAEDEDCDGLVDAEEITVLESWFADADGDGFGDPARVVVAPCPPDGWVGDARDCDDEDSDVHPFGAEIQGDDVDQNCDGHTGAEDTDADGADADHDCDDTDASAFPGATEVSDGGDDDCDGLVDEYDGDLVLTSVIEARAFCAAYAAVDGALRVDGMASLRGLDCLTAVTGDLHIANVEATDLRGLEQLCTVGADLHLGGATDSGEWLGPNAFTTLKGLSRLRRIGDDLGVVLGSGISLDGILRLAVVGGDVTLWRGDVTHIVLPMKTIGGNVSIGGMSSLVALSAPDLEVLDGNLTLTQVPLLPGFLLDWPAPIHGTLGLVDFTGGDLTGATLPDTVGGLRIVASQGARVSGLDDITRIDGDAIWSTSVVMEAVSGLDNLTEVTGALRIVDNSVLAGVELPALTTVGGDLVIEDNPDLGQDYAEAWAATLDVGGDTIIRRNN